MKLLLATVLMSVSTMSFAEDFSKVKTEAECKEKKGKWEGKKCMADKKPAEAAPATTPAEKPASEMKTH